MARVFRKQVIGTLKRQHSQAIAVSALASNQQSHQLNTTLIEIITRIDGRMISNKKKIAEKYLHISCEKQKLFIFRKFINKNI